MMITDILKEKTPEQKPRFFLHDEVKAWLADNLEIKFRLAPTFSHDYKIWNKLQSYFGIHQVPMMSLKLEAKVFIGKEQIQDTFSENLLTDSVPLYELLIKQHEQIEQKLSDIVNENNKLRQRIEVLENPTSV